VFALLGQLTVSYSVTRAEFDPLYARLRSDEQAVMLVADIDGRVRAYALAIVSVLLHVGGASAQLQELVVDESVRGTGIGTQLLRAIEEQCRHRGARQLVVASRRASLYYSARGYELTADYLNRLL
jgi:GNAT superfamily N-acetyltransferase